MKTTRFLIAAFVAVIATKSIAESNPSQKPYFKGKGEGIVRLKGAISQQFAMLDVLRYSLVGFAEKSGGKWPKDWSEIEAVLEFGAAENAQQWRRVKEAFLLLQPEQGELLDGPNVGLKGSIVALSKDELAGNSGPDAYGRYALWRLESGNFVGFWHERSELHSFSGWTKLRQQLDKLQQPPEKPLEPVVKLPKVEPLDSAVQPSGNSREAWMSKSIQTGSSPNVARWIISGVLLVLLSVLLLRRALRK